MRKLELLVWVKGPRGWDPTMEHHLQDHKYNCSYCAWFSCFDLPDVGPLFLLQEFQALGVEKIP